MYVVIEKTDRETFDSYLWHHEALKGLEQAKKLCPDAEWGIEESDFEPSFDMDTRREEAAFRERGY